MKRLCLLFIGLMTLLSAMAQSDLHVAPFFTNKFAKSHKATMVKLKKDALKDYPLLKFQSITVALTPQEVETLEQALAKDTQNAEQQESATKHGRLYYGFYELKRQNNQLRGRFLFYRNNGLQPKGTPNYTLIYMEGFTTLAQLKRIFAP